MSPNRLWDSPGRPVLIDAPQCWPSRTAAGASPKSSGALPHRLRRRTVRKADGTGRARPTEACRLMPAHAARRSPIRSARNRRLLRQPPGHSPRAGHPRPLDRGHPFGTACAARRVPIPERLAVLTGRGVHAFAGALPELREPATGLGDVSATRRRPAATSAMPVTGRGPAPAGPHLRLSAAQHLDRPARHRPAGRRSRSASGGRRRPAPAPAHHAALRLEATYDAVLSALMICAHIWADGRLPGETFRS